MKWYEIKALSEEKAEIWIYEQIGEDLWDGSGVTAKGFQKDLAAVKARQIDLHINSPGGVVFDGITIYNLLKQHPAKITTYIDGLAASIASVIALAGDTVVMAENALYMIHNPFGMAYGNAKELRAYADVLEKVGGSMLSAYKAKTGMDEAELLALLDAETWLTAAEAKEHGFVDEIAEEMDMAACAKFVPSLVKAGVKNIPDILNKKEEITPKVLEKALRDAGCSRAQAKSILVHGLRDADREPGKGDLRDADHPEPLDDVAQLISRAALLRMGKQK